MWGGKPQTTETGFAFSMPKNRKVARTHRRAFAEADRVLLCTTVVLADIFVSESCLLHPRQWHLKEQSWNQFLWPNNKAKL
jgi:hypothetical protein